MITSQQIWQLQAFRNGVFLVTSCYLNLDRREASAQALKIRIKDLLQSAQHQLDKKAGTHQQRESLRDDFVAIEAHVMPAITASQHKAVAIFSCVGEKFWQAFSLPQIERNILIADHAPHLHPLNAILAEHHRCCVVVVNRTHGRIFETYLGEIVERGDVTDMVPRRVREAGFGGRDERNMERHLTQVVEHHYQHLADAVCKLFRKDHFDWLILAGQREPVHEFQKHLHPDLRQRLVGDFHADPAKITVPEVLQQAGTIEQRVECDHEFQLATELVQKSDAGHGAVTGLTAVLAALDRGEAQTLVVEKGFEKSGHACVVCHYPSLLPAECPHCHRPTGPCTDIVDEAVALALHRNCQIRHIQGATPLHTNGHIGARLRFQAA